MTNHTLFIVEPDAGAFLKNGNLIVKHGTGEEDAVPLVMEVYN